MKKVYQYLLLAGLVVLAAACENEIAIDNGVEGSEQQMITETISANILGETKATVDASAKFAWTVGDNIAVHVSNGKYVFTSGTGGASEAAASASFTVSYPSGTSRDAFAIFPSTIVAANATNYGQSEHSLDVTLPASYALDEVSGTATPCPMIATNTPGSGWTFSQLCGLLRLTVNSIPSDATGLIIQFPGKKVSGNFSIAKPVTPGSSTIQVGSSNTEDKITVTFDAGITSATINLPLPTGDYEDVFITPVSSATKVAAVRHIFAGYDNTGSFTPGKFTARSYTARAAHGKKLTATMVSFSVAANKQVVFAPGNLIATVTAMSSSTPSAVSWSFQNHPSDRLYKTTTSNAYSTFEVGKSMEFFGWGTSGWAGSGVTSWVNYQPWSTSRTNLHSSDPANTYALNVYGYGPDSNCYKGYGDEGYQTEWNTNAASQAGLWETYANGDWGVYNPIGPYPANTWRTPRSAEWEYLINGRTVSNTLNDGARYMLVRVGEKPFGSSGEDPKNWEGYLVLFPDNYTHPSGVAINGSPVYNSYSNCTAYVVDYAAFDKMEEAGATMLFLAGGRGAVTVSPYGSGSYWSSDANINPLAKSQDNPKGECHRLSISANASNGHVRTWGASRYWGYSVRLVRDLN